MRSASEAHDDVAARLTETERALEDAVASREAAERAVESASDAIVEVEGSTKEDGADEAFADELAVFDDVDDLYEDDTPVPDSPDLASELVEDAGYEAACHADEASAKAALDAVHAAETTVLEARDEVERGGSGGQPRPTRCRRTSRARRGARGGAQCRRPRRTSTGRHRRAPQARRGKILRAGGARPARTRLLQRLFAAVVDGVHRPERGAPVGDRAHGSAACGERAERGARPGSGDARPRPTRPCSSGCAAAGLERAPTAAADAGRGAATGAVRGGRRPPRGSVAGAGRRVGSRVRGPRGVRASPRPTPSTPKESSPSSRRATMKQSSAWPRHASAPTRTSMHRVAVPQTSPPAIRPLRSTATGGERRLTSSTGTFSAGWPHVDSIRWPIPSRSSSTTCTDTCQRATSTHCSSGWTTSLTPYTSCT